MDSDKDTIMAKEKLPEVQPSRTGATEEMGEVGDIADQTLTPQQNRKLLLKTNGVILSIMVLASLIAFLDKASAASFLQYRPARPLD